MSDKSLLLPFSILAAGALVGAGLFLGLRSRAPELPAAPAATSTEVRDGAAEVRESAPTRIPAPLAEPAPAGDTGLSMPPVSAEAKTKATKDAATALQDARKDFVKKCWEPAVKKEPKPDASTYLFNLSFDANGREIGRGITELRDEQSRADVADCLRREGLSLSIPPPGVNVSVDVKLKLP